MEKWIQWEPIEGLASKYYIEAIIKSLEELKIRLADEKNKYNKATVTFFNYIETYRRVNETYRLKLWSNLDQHQEELDYSKWTFFKVENSAFLKWLSNESHTTDTNQSLQHFALITDDEIIDILSSTEPTVMLTNGSHNYGRKMDSMESH